jgi:hypothetical protein
MTKTSPRKLARRQHPSQSAIPSPAKSAGSKNKPEHERTKRSKTATPFEVQTPAARPGGARRHGSKLDILIQLMQSKSGASIDQLVKATGWQAHSVRGAISGALKKKLGLKVVSERVDEVRVYRIAK